MFVSTSWFVCSFVGVCVGVRELRSLSLSPSLLSFRFHHRTNQRGPVLLRLSLSLSSHNVILEASRTFIHSLTACTMIVGPTISSSSSSSSAASWCSAPQCCSRQVIAMTVLGTIGMLVVLSQLIPAASLFESEPVYVYDFEVHMPRDTRYIADDTHSLQWMLEWPSIFGQLSHAPKNISYALDLYTGDPHALDNRLWTWCSRNDSIASYRIVSRCDSLSLSCELTTNSTTTTLTSNSSSNLSRSSCWCLLDSDGGWLCVGIRFAVQHAMDAARTSAADLDHLRGARCRGARGHDGARSTGGGDLRLRARVR